MLIPVVPITTPVLIAAAFFIFIRVALMLDNNLVFAADGIWQKINREKGIPKP